MTTEEMDLTARAREIAAGLSKAQRAGVMSRTAGAATVESLMRKGLWSGGVYTGDLTDLGRAVAAILAEPKG